MAKEYLKKASCQSLKPVELVIVGLGICLAIALRLSLFGFESDDYRGIFSYWYDFITFHGGLSAFKYNFSDYSPLILYFFKLATYIPLPKLYAIKLVSITFDFLLASFVLLIVRLKYETKIVWIYSFLVALFVPTVVLNSALWGQSDATYASMLLASIYFAIQRKRNLSLFFFAVAFSFKLQAIFLFPLFIILLLKKRVPLHSLLIIPITYLISVLPAWLVGRSLIELLMIYPAQAGEYSGVDMDGPSLYQWLPNNPELFEKASIVGSGLLVCLLCLFCWRSTVCFDRDVIIKLSLVSLLLVPITLPEMHERYFFAADIVSIIYTFYWPKRFVIPILVVGSSLLSYISYLFYQEELISPRYLAILMGIALIVVIVDLSKSLYPNSIEQLRWKQVGSS